MCVTLSKYRSTMSRPQKVHTHLPGSAAPAGVKDEDEESDDGEKQSSSKMSSEPEEPCHKYAKVTKHFAKQYDFTNFCVMFRNSNCRRTLKL